MTSSQADRTAPFTTLWDSYTAESSAQIAMLFNRAADQIERDGYDRYSKTEDETSTGITLFEALERVAREHVVMVTSPIVGGTFTHMTAKMVDTDTDTLREELELRLAGVLYVTGQLRANTPFNGMADVLFGWTRDPATWHTVGGRYRGQAHITRLLRLAAVMTAATDAG